eukprot:TRINITY_DN2099_c0_g1_i6.p1 TRINITY_DN2099_c0_g1~~TRINITY_DN2099_c0_g1_i6.p1  ORF type:complete len:288 (+),score=-25.46 TRINITY_DN2099_c0_g1_i6:799-1662(+)
MQPRKSPPLANRDIKDSCTTLRRNYYKMRSFIDDSLQYWKKQIHTQQKYEKNNTYYIQIDIFLFQPPRIVNKLSTFSLIYKCVYQYNKILEININFVPLYLQPQWFNYMCIIFELYMYYNYFNVRVQIFKCTYVHVYVNFQLMHFDIDKHKQKQCIIIVTTFRHKKQYFKTRIQLPIPLCVISIPLCVISNPQQMYFKSHNNTYQIYIKTFIYIHPQVHTKSPMPQPYPLPPLVRKKNDCKNNNAGNTQKLQLKIQNVIIVTATTNRVRTIMRSLTKFQYLIYQYTK